MQGFPEAVCGLLKEVKRPHRLCCQETLQNAQQPWSLLLQSSILRACELACNVGKHHCRDLYHRAHYLGCVGVAKTPEGIVLAWLNVQGHLELVRRLHVTAMVLLHS